MMFRVSINFLEDKYSLHTQHSATVFELKVAIQELANIPVEWQVLFYDGSRLQDGSQLSHYGITDQSELILQQRIPPLRILLLYKDSKLPQFVKDSTTVLGLKVQIECFLSIPTEKQELMFEGAFLEDGDKLRTYGIDDGSEVGLLEKNEVSIVGPKQQQRYHLYVHGSASVEETKLMVLEKYNVDISAKLLLTEDTIGLTDGAASLASYGITDGSRIRFLE